MSGLGIVQGTSKVLSPRNSQHAIPILLDPNSKTTKVEVSELLAWTDTTQYHISFIQNLLDVSVVSTRQVGIRPLCENLTSIFLLQELLAKLQDVRSKITNTYADLRENVPSLVGYGINPSMSSSQIDQPLLTASGKILGLF